MHLLSPGSKLASRVFAVTKGPLEEALIEHHPPRSYPPRSYPPPIPSCLNFANAVNPLSGSKLAFRAFTVTTGPLDEALIEQRLSRAAALRSRLFPDRQITNGFRMVNGVYRMHVQQQ